MKTPLKILIMAAAGLALPAIASADAAANWKTHCAKCHGADGSASGAVGKKLGLKDYTSAAVQAAMTDEENFTATKDGVKNEAGKMIMPEYGSKLSDDDIHALVALIRTFKKD